MPKNPRPLPSSLIAASLLSFSAAVGLSACAGPGAARTQTPPADPGTVSASASAAASMATPPASGAATTAPATQPSPTPSASGTQLSAATSTLPLAPSQLPAFALEAWTAQKSHPATNVTGHNVELNECADVIGAVTWQQQPYVSASGGDSAILETYTFGTAVAARTALAHAVAGMRSCQATSRSLQVAAHMTADAVSEQTASATEAAAFERTWTGVSGVSAYGPQTNHLYLAASGTTLVVLHFDEFGKKPAPYDVRDDAAVLTTLDGVLDR